MSLRRLAMLALVLAAGMFFCGCTMPKQGQVEPSEGAAGPPMAEQQRPAPGDVKIGFIVKQPEEPWFQTEWKFADRAAEEYGFELLKIGAPTAEEALSAIDNIAAQGAQGFIICTPQVRIGPAIVQKAQRHGLKLISVDDQFLDADGRPMKDVHYLGISAYRIGRLVGEHLYEEMQRRGWTQPQTAACGVTYDQLDTIKNRTDGARDALIDAGFAEDRIHEAPLRELDVPSAMTAVETFLVQHPEPDKWLVYGGNDSSVLGAVRALENRDFRAGDVIGIGISGMQAVGEFQKDRSTGFYGSILLEPKRHGYETAQMMYKWIQDGEEPPKDTRTTGVLVTRDNYVEEFKRQGLWQQVAPEMD